MEQGGDERGIGGDRDMNQHQPLDQRVNEMQQGGDMQQAQVQSQRPQQPKQCPRCNSINTKFCYYNNYNVTQPRHYCKTCRRYWTQGGALRNIPIGGGCHKRKHAKNSSSSRSQQPQPSPPPQEVVVQMQQPQPPRPQDVIVQTHQSNLKAMVKATTDPCLMVPHSTNPFYQGGGGYFSSLPAIHSMNQSQSSRYDKSIKIGGDLAGSSSNLGLAPGFNVGSLASQSQCHVYQMGGREREVQSQYMPQQGLIIPSSMNTIHTSVPVHTDWSQSFINNVDNRTCDASLWSTISNNTTSISGNIDRSGNGVGSSPLVQNEWSDFSGYGPPPSSY